MGEPSPTAKGRGDRDSPTLPALESLSVDELRQHLEELRRLQKDQRVREQQQQLQLQQLLLLQQQQQQPSPPLPQLVTPFSALDAHTASVCVPQVSSDLYRTAGLGSVGFAGGYPLGAGSADVVNRAGVVPVPIAAAAGVGSMGSAGHIAAPAPTHPQTTLDQQLAANLQQQQRQQQQQLQLQQQLHSNSNKRLVAAEELLIEAQVNLRCLRWPVPEARRSPVFSHSMPTRQARSDPWMVALTA